MMNTTETLDKIISIIGGKAMIAKRFGISYQAVHKWQKKGRIPAKRVLEIVKMTGGKVTPYEVRPDVYPDPGWMPFNNDK